MESHEQQPENSKMTDLQMTIQQKREAILLKTNFINKDLGEKILRVVYTHYGDEKSKGVIYNRGEGKSPSIDLNRIEDSIINIIYNMITSHETKVRQK